MVGETKYPNIQVIYMMKNSELTNEINSMQDSLIDIRRDFHRYPELGMEETRTSEKIIEYLEDWGIPYESGIANTGIVGMIEGSETGETVALRADMDALPIIERNQVDYKSEIDGKMHACGHDAHMTVQLGAAKILHENRQHLKGNVKLFFQPAEETVGGAKPMIHEGVMENPEVKAVFGLHMDPEIPTGKIGLKYGQMNASSDTFYITVKGESAHGAYPHQGTDAIHIASQIISKIHTITGRNIDPRNTAVISIGTIEGGTQSNIIADEVKMSGTIRTVDEETRQLIIQKIEDILQTTTSGMNGDFEIEYGSDGYAALINDDRIVDLVKESGQDLLGSKNIVQIDQVSMGVEDFSFFAQAAPSAFFRLGVRNEEKGIIHGLHSSKFDIDEKSLPIGVALQVQNVLHFLNGK